MCRAEGGGGSSEQELLLSVVGNYLLSTVTKTQLKDQRMKFKLNPCLNTIPQSNRSEQN